MKHYARDRRRRLRLRKLLLNGKTIITEDANGGVWMAFPYFDRYAFLGYL